MPTASFIEQTPRNRRSAQPNPVAVFLLDDCVSGLTNAIRQACLDDVALIPYRVRQALDCACQPLVSKKLTQYVLALPHSDQTYTRHVLHADPAGLFTVVALRWERHQASPVHAHFTWCAYKVLSGELTESHFEWDRSAEQAYLFNRVARAVGQSVCGHEGLDLIHRLGNEQTQTAVSIHVYGVAAANISTHVNRKLSVKLDL